MIGIPDVLNTKQDVLNCIEYADKGMLNKSELALKIKSLKNDEKVWMFKEYVDSDYTPLENEKVMEEETIDDNGNKTTKYVCFEFVDNPNALYIKMGFTKDEIDQYITKLEG
jgi:3-oxoacyl-[acyl-carrier-protein] synthase III